MELIVQILTILGSFSPIAVIALLGVVILLMVKSSKQVDTIKGNDLHHIDAHLERISDTLQRIEVTLAILASKVDDLDE